MIKTKQELLNHFSDINKMYNNSFMYQTLSNMIDELLESQPCEDCISREQAVYVASGYCAPQNIADELRKLPSVKPQPKMGHWIDVENLDSALWHECSECGETEFYATDYCPNCGTKMEVEE